MKEVLIPSDRRWVLGYEEKYRRWYAMDMDGVCWSYRGHNGRRGTPHRMKSVVHEGNLCVEVYCDEEGTRRRRLSDFMAWAWYGTDDYYFDDGNPNHIALANIVPLLSAPPGEAWIEGYEGRHSVDAIGVTSYFNHFRTYLKPSKQGKITLRKNGKKENRSFATLIRIARSRLDYNGIIHNPG